MDDLISRQAAIDAMMRLQTEDIEMYGCAIPEGFDGDRAAEALKALPPAQPERKTGRWIPCSERLPEEDKYVLCTTITTKGRLSVVRGYYSGKVWVCGMNNNVIAWTPLPEPYGEDEHEK